MPSTSGQHWVRYSHGRTEGTLGDRRGVLPFAFRFNVNSFGFQREGPARIAYERTVNGTARKLI